MGPSSSSQKSAVQLILEDKRNEICSNLASLNSAVNKLDQTYTKISCNLVHNPENYFNIFKDLKGVYISKLIYNYKLFD